MTTRVVHVRSRAWRETPEAERVRVMRPSKWGNPHFLGRESDRALVIALYREHLLRRPDLLAALPELKGKTLGCVCDPKPCHGGVLKELVDALPDD